MRKILCFCLALVLVFSGCMYQPEVSEGDGVRFYYRDKREEAYFSETGIMASEMRSIRWEQQSIKGLMEVYLQGPVSSELISPFPKDLQLLDTQILPGEITLTFNDSLSSLSPAGLRVAAGCIARTLWEYGGYETVILKAQTQLLDEKDRLVLYPEEFVLRDRNVGQPNIQMRLYFADAQERFLIEEQRTEPVDGDVSLPEYILRSLIAGPQSEQLQPTIPEGTALLDVSVLDGTCFVYFSSEFWQNRPKQQLEERMTVFSVVNSLTQLEEINSVKIVAEGEPGERYLYLDLSEPFVEDKSLIGPVRSGTGEYDATLYLCLEGNEQLAEFPIRLQETVDTDHAEQVLQALAGFTARNGYYSPLAQYGEVQSIQVDNGLVHVDFAPGLMEQCSSEQEKTMLLRSIVATLCSLEEVQALYLYENGTPIPLTKAQSEILTDWFLP